MNPELALVAACCRWPDDDQRRAAIAAAGQAVADWPRVAALAAAHRVEGLVDHGLRSAAIAVPEAVAEALAAAAAEIRLLNLRAMGEMLRLAAAFDRTGLPMLFLKGIPLGVRAYGTAILKRSLDIDLLVAPRDVVAAARVLGELGYRPRIPPRPLTDEEFERWSYVSKEAQFESERGIVDFHWGLADQPALLPDVDVASGSCRVGLIGDRSVATLADAPNLAYLAVHGALHGWSRLKWLADFAAFVAAHDQHSRNEMIAAARLLAPGRALDQAFALADRLLGAGIRPSSPMASDQAVHRMADLALEVIAARRLGVELERDRMAFGKVVRLQRLLQPGLRYRLAEWRRQLRQTETRLRLRFPVPRRWHWLYQLLRLPGEIAGRLWRVIESGPRS